MNKEISEYSKHAPGRELDQSEESNNEPEKDVKPEEKVETPKEEKIFKGIGEIETNELTDADKESPEFTKHASNRVKEEAETNEKVEVDISGEVSKDLGDLFKVIKKKFNNPDDNWTPARLEANSTEKLGPIINEFRNKLKEGGSANPDDIIQEIINEAISHAQKGGSKHDFMDIITNPAKVTNQKVVKFNRFIANSLEK